MEESNVKQLNNLKNKIRVLTVEDVTGNTSRLRGELPYERFEVIGTLNRKEALKYLREDPLPDIMIIDLYLPESPNIRMKPPYLRESIKLVEQVKGDEHTKHIPIIVYTSYKFYLKTIPSFTQEEVDKTLGILEKHGIAEDTHFVSKLKDIKDPQKPAGIKELISRIEQIVIDSEEQDDESD